ncbi:MAG: ATP-binding cassette domain-containing protein [Streptosporangiales bacterium]|nr:ATP-binding cassette domain-containing protein [Streptosporangiales bacterium]
MCGLRKRYGGVVALDGADLAAARGEVHALLGPNGSGKSTLLKVLTGVVAADAGEVRLDGEPLVTRGPRDALRAGVAAVYQELSLLDDLSVAENLVLGVEPVRRGGLLDRRAAERRAAPVLERFADAFGGAVPLRTPAGALDPGERQVVEVCKALVRRPRLLVLDEATASLRQRQVDVLFDVVRELRDEGVLVLFISHRLAEVRGLAARATILRGGRHVATVDVATTAEDELVRLMVGELATVPRAASAATEQVRLQVTDLAGPGMNGVSLTVRSGEIVGLGGLQGQGQAELLGTLFGARRRRGGEVEIDGEPVRAPNPAQAIRAGIAYVPGDRGSEGLALRRPILENLALPSLRTRSRGGLLSRRRETRAARATAERLATRYGSLSDLAATLSGGNQQKLVVAKWFPVKPRVVLLDDPLKGIDVRAKAELFAVIRELAQGGAAVLFGSSDDRELIELCDRVLVMFEGRVADELAGPRLSDDTLIASALQVNGGGS